MCTPEEYWKIAGQYFVQEEAKAGLGIKIWTGSSKLNFQKHTGKRSTIVIICAINL